MGWVRINTAVSRTATEEDFFCRAGFVGAGEGIAEGSVGCEEAGGGETAHYCSVGVVFHDYLAGADEGSGSGDEGGWSCVGEGEEG